MLAIIRRMPPSTRAPALATPSPADAPRRRGRPTKASGDAAGDIRRAALQRFGRQGFEGCSVVDIAREAGVAKPLVHYHYQTKELLWQAAVGEALAQLQQHLAELTARLSTLPPHEAFRHGAPLLVQHAARHAALVRIVVEETGRASERAEWLLREHLMPMYGVARLGWLQLQRTGALRPDAPPIEHVIPSVLGLMHFAFLEAEVIQRALGHDVQSPAYIARQGELLYQWFATQCLSAPAST